MTHPKPFSLAAAFVAALGLLALSTGSAFAAKDRFYRTKPHVNVSASSMITGGGTQAHVDPNDPWKKRAKWQCIDGYCRRTAK